MENDSVLRRPVRQRFAVWVATGFGVGLFVPAPGTVGTALWGLPVAFLFSFLPGSGWQIAGVVAMFLIGVPLTTVANRALGAEKDHQSIVWDEIASMPIVFLLVPMSNWRVAVAGFLLHRLFDITKPPPAAQLERLPSGWGIMADDLMAAIYAGIALWGVALLDERLGWMFLSISHT
jgi:phosphatidylglycerophosphatase A